MTSFKGEPFKDLTSIQERMNKIFSESLSRLKEISGFEADKPWSPPVDIFELPDAFVLLAEIPGIPRERISVDIEGGTLVIRGERPQVEDVAEGNLHHSERHYGSFERSFNLPVNVTPERITAKTSGGVLTVTIAKPEEEARLIKVSIE
ncbi:MAG: Hsp20/alpha crystallin family protein [Thermodesulfobacteriota bacterium]|nr:Hsp20/alpha crystallin family protein [Thermodesulfobacteriota bacterium]